MTFHQVGSRGFAGIEELRWGAGVVESPHETSIAQLNRPILPTPPQGVA